MYNTVPPGVSYTPLDLIPINLFSTRSTLPIAFLPAKRFNFSNSFSGFSFFPLIATGSPFLKEILPSSFCLELFLEKLFFEI